MDMTAFDQAWRVVKYCGIPNPPPWHPNEPPPIPSVHDIPPLRQLQEVQPQPFGRTTGGASPTRIKRHDGATSVSSKKGDSRDDKSSSEKIIDARLNRLGLGGERGEPKGNSQ
jgi:hypothetical protein